MKELSIVIPLDLHRRPRDIYKRVQHYLEILAEQNIQVILGCNTQPNTWYNKISHLVKKTNNFKLIPVDCVAHHLSKIRNTALAHVETPWVLFMDIDLYPDPTLIEQTLLQVKQHSDQICMYPCLYLTEYATHKFKKYNPSVFKQHYYDFRRDLILHLAFPSSVIICDLSSVQAIQGFDEQYCGHGYEDFDFMLRLFVHKGLIKYSAEVLKDEVYQAPLMSIGFRALLAAEQLERLIGEQYFVHLFHAKDKEDPYYVQRQNNAAYFLQKFSMLQATSREENHVSSEIPFLLQKFNQLISKQGLKRQAYAALWAEIPGHKFRKRSIKLFLGGITII